MRFGALTSPAALGVVTRGLSTREASKQCTNMTIPVTLAARNAVFNIPTLSNNLDATTFFQNVSNIGGNFTEESLVEYRDETGTYNISAQYCTNGSDPTTLLFLTHGIGFDKSYWDLAYNDFAYSFVDRAIAAGYATFSIDRLGVGMSTHADPVQVVQFPAELSTIQVLTSQIRDGKVDGVPTPQKIAHVGHSFGSELTMGLSVMAPNLTDAVVLTGFSYNSSFQPQAFASFNSQLAKLNQPDRFGDLDPGFLTWINNQSNQFAFLYPSGFEPSILTFSESTKYPYTVGEILTQGGGSIAKEFKGSVLVLTGVEDAIFCGGNCYSTGGVGASIPDAVAKAFPVASAFETYLPTTTGHAVNLHYNAQSSYTYILDFLKKQGL